MELAIKAARGEDLEERKDRVKEAEVLYRSNAQNGAAIADRKEEERLLFSQAVLRDGAVVLRSFIETVQVFERFFVRASKKILVTERTSGGGGFSSLPLDNHGLQDTLRMFKERTMDASILLTAGFFEDALGTGAKQTSAQLNWLLSEGQQIMVLSGGAYSKRLQSSLEVSMIPELQLALNDLGKSLLNQLKG